MVVTTHALAPFNTTFGTPHGEACFNKCTKEQRKNASNNEREHSAFKDTPKQMDRLTNLHLGRHVSSLYILIEILDSPLQNPSISVK